MNWRRRLWMIYAARTDIFLIAAMDINFLARRGCQATPQITGPYFLSAVGTRCHQQIPITSDWPRKGPLFKVFTPLKEIVMLRKIAIVLCLAPLAVSADPGINYFSACNGKPASQQGFNGNDILVGTSGNDVITGGGGNDTIYGMGGNDLLCGFSGADKLYGGPGNDILLGDGNNQTLEDGNDILQGGPGKDRCIGGRGKDTGKACEIEKGM